MGSICTGKPNVVENTKVVNKSEKLNFLKEENKSDSLIGNRLIKPEVITSKKSDLDYYTYSLNKEFQKGDIIGKGRLGVVYRSLALESGGLAVTKCLNLEELKSKNKERDYQLLLEAVDKTNLYENINLTKYFACMKSQEDPNSKHIF
jgi:hypothetical protein